MTPLARDLLAVAARSCLMLSVDSSGGLRCRWLAGTDPGLRRRLVEAKDEILEALREPGPFGADDPRWVHLVGTDDDLLDLWCRAAAELVVSGQAQDDDTGHRAYLRAIGETEHRGHEWRADA